MLEGLLIYLEQPQKQEFSKLGFAPVHTFYGMLGTDLEGIQLRM